MKPYAVRAAHCDHRASEEEILDTLRNITAPLARSWQRLESARTIVIKANLVWPQASIKRFEGRYQELVDVAVFRSVLRLLRERTRARLLVADTTYTQERPGTDVNFLPILAELGAEYVECNDPPVARQDVPGGGLMFGNYPMHACLKEADAVVSVAKMKSHGFMGVTLCLKNLFGLSPLKPVGRPRTYFHHIIRLPYVLADLGLMTQPCLNIVDGLVGQTGWEWGGEGRVADALVAGDHVIATDACAAWLMGHDPTADWPTPPFRRDRNALLVAAERGFGAVDLAEIDFETDLRRPVAAFDSAALDPSERVESWRRTMCQQALYYRDHSREIVGRYAGRYILLQDGEVVWDGPDPENLGSRRVLSGDRKDSALWMKWVDADETEGERFEVYEKVLARMQEK